MSAPRTPRVARPAARARALVAHAMGALGRRASRNAAIVVGLAFAVSLFGSALFVVESLRAIHRRASREAPTLVVSRLEGGRPALLGPEEGDAIRELLGVRAVEPRVWGYVYLGALEGNVVVYGETRTADVPRDRVTVGPGVARLLGLRVGDRLAVSTPSHQAVYRVAEILPPSTALVSYDALLVDVREAHLLLAIPEGRATDLAVDVFPPEEVPVVAEEIGQRMPTARVLQRDDLARLYELTFDARGGVLGALLLPALAALLLLAWERLSGLSLEERREIGVLKAVGWATEDVLAVRMIEAGLIALFGTVIGLLLAYLHVYVFEAALLSRVMLGWSSLRTPLALAPATDVSTLAALVALVVVPFTAVSAFPAWRAASIDPDRALRGP
ncbi:MAG: FtsX-like permease family protein [Sandaracinaceae bacterium]|nr:FtsX-like permease family protein [Sandaracinaceae bacterium]